jgi:hypothetical protein
VHRYNCRSSSAIAARIAARNSLRLGVGFSTTRSLNLEAEIVSRTTQKAEGYSSFRVPNPILSVSDLWISISRILFQKTNKLVR